ncbi:MAG: hypothetical protein ACTSRC_05725 [Candidatus Helarchaeota archaeon]
MKQITENRITLVLPYKIRLTGLFLIILGIIIPVLLYFNNGYQTILVTGSLLKSIISNASFFLFLSYLIILEIPSIYYFFSSHNMNTAYGHILLVFLNLTAYIGTTASIFSFAPVLITGIYFITHFKNIRIDNLTETIHFQERILLLFFTHKQIPFSELKEIILEYKVSRNSHQYGIQLYILEKDPGFEDVPLNVEAEKDSLEFFRPQTLRKTLLSKPFLLDSSYFNFRGYEMKKFDEVLKNILIMTRFVRRDEIKKGNRTINKYRK